MRNLVMWPMLTFLMVLLVCGSIWADCFDYASEELGSLEKVRQEYGEQPLVTIKPIVADRDHDYTSWRRAVAAVSFLGSEGAEFLGEELMAAIARADYGTRTSDLLDALGRVVDKRSSEASLVILRSAAPRELSLSAAAVLSKQVRATHLVKHVSVPGVSPEGNQTLSIHGIGGIGRSFCGETYSYGIEMNKEEMCLLRVQLADLLVPIDKRDREIGECVRNVISTIDTRVYKLEAEENAVLARDEKSGR